MHHTQLLDAMCSISCIPGRARRGGSPWEHWHSHQPLVDWVLKEGFGVQALVSSPCLLPGWNSLIRSTERETETWQGDQNPSKPHLHRHMAEARCDIINTNSTLSRHAFSVLVTDTNYFLDVSSIQAQTQPDLHPTMESVPPTALPPTTLHDNSM